MTMKELSRLSEQEIHAIEMHMASTGNMRALGLIADVKMYYHKQVKVVKGRKVPKGTTGECFWMGSNDYSKYGDPWGIYTTVRIGIRDDEGKVWWTSLDNVELID